MASDDNTLDAATIQPSECWLSLSFHMTSLETHSTTPLFLSQLEALEMAEPAQKKAKMERTFLFSSESVNEGHPDKLCDQVSDAVLDTCLTEDPKSKVACETATKDNMAIFAAHVCN